MHLFTNYIKTIIVFRLYSRQILKFNVTHFFLSNYCLLLTLMSFIYDVCYHVMIKTFFLLLQTLDCQFFHCYTVGTQNVIFNAETTFKKIIWRWKLASLRTDFCRISFVFAPIQTTYFGTNLCTIRGR